MAMALTEYNTVAPFCNDLLARTISCREAIDATAAVSFALAAIEEQLPQLLRCTSYEQRLGNVFCEEILRAVHRHGLFPDSKDFVDSPIKAEPAEIISFFLNCVDAENFESVKDFVERFFAIPASEIFACIPQDWRPEPAPLSAIACGEYREWAKSVNNIWLELCRQVKPEVRDEQDHYTLIYVPHTFVAPGGRFREFYYWDSYWILRGLITCEMFQTAKDTIKNLAYIISRYGFIPNGQRVYYLNRSQPPMFIPMVFEYFKATEDMDFLREMMPFMEMEYSWWYRNRTVEIELADGTSCAMFRYCAATKKPRVESFKEDVHTASHLFDVEVQQQLYQDIASAAESGWDFSSRWFVDGAGLQDAVTSKILPADLNAFMCYNAKLMTTMETLAGNETRADQYQQHYDRLMLAYNELFWDEEEGTWFDYLLDGKCHNKKFYGSLAVPIFTGCYADLEQVRRAYHYCKASGALSTRNGMPASMISSGEQWDFPNGWAILIHMLVIGLKDTGDCELQTGAKEIAGKWLSSNYKQFQKTGAMYEKYNVCNEDAVGSGGEYEVQTGFGWSNGSILDLLSIYADEDWLVSGSNDSNAVCKAMLECVVNDFASCAPHVELITVVV